MPEDFVHLRLCFATRINDCRMIGAEPSIHAGRALKAVDVSMNDTLAEQVQVQVVLACLSDLSVTLLA